MNKYFVLLLLFVSFPLFSQLNFSALTISPELKENANSVFLNELIEVDVTDPRKMIYKGHRELVVLNSSGDKHAYSVVYYDNDRKVKAAEATVYNFIGEEIAHFKKRDFKDVSATGTSLYQDDRQMYLDYTPTVYPYTIVFDFVIESNTTAFVFDWYPLKGYASSTKKSVYKVNFDPNNKLKYHPNKLEEYDILVEETPSQLIFTAENLKAIKHESMVKDFSQIAPRVSFGLQKFYLNGVYADVKNWEEFGSWVHTNLLSNVSELPETTVNKVKELIKNETTNEAKARIVYQFLQDKVRYISIQIGIGGWRPMLASDVDRLSYGDCKALTNYTKAMLDAVGIPSYYTILYSGANGEDITKGFPRFQGDHVILGVPDGDKITWLECTSQEIPFGFIGDFTDDRDVLIITPEGGKIVHTTIYDFEDNTQDIKAEIKLENNGLVAASFNCVSKGLQYNHKYYLTNLKQKEINDYYADKWSNINGYSVEDIQLDNNKEEVVFTEKLTLNSLSYCSSIGDDLLFSVNMFNQLNFIPPRIKDRKQELFISEGFKDTDTYNILMPLNYTIDEIPEDKVIENKFGKYQVKYIKISDKELEYQRLFMLRKGTYPAEDYNEFRNFMKKVSKLDKTKILLIKEK